MNLKEFFYTEVMELYKTVTIPLEETGIQLDMALLAKTQQEITRDLEKLEWGIQEAIVPHLGIFTEWFLNKDYPTETWSTKKPTAWTKLHKTQADAWRFDNPDSFMFNLQSKYHLKKLFFDTLKETPLSKTPTGLPQVDEEFLDSMALKYTWAADLIQYNKLNKLKGTYIDRFLEDQEDGILYPSFMQHRTVSGRYGSNIQQMPRSVDASSGILVARYTNLVRSFITARPGNKLISADYAQLEPRTFCHVSGDEALRDIFISGQDFYTTIGCRVLGLLELTKKQRQDAKVYALGIPYGMTGFKLKFEIGCTQETANALVNSYLSSFPKLQSWMHSTKCFARDDSNIKSQLGRIRHLPQIPALFNKYGRAIEDDLELWKRYNEYPAVYAQAKQDRRMYKNCMNNALNYQIQSMAASIINRASIALNRNLKSQGLKARLVAQVHDELILDIPESEVETVSKLVQDAMENTTRISVPLIAKPVVAFRYSDCK